MVLYGQEGEGQQWQPRRRCGRSHPQDCQQPHQPSDTDAGSQVSSEEPIASASDNGIANVRSI